MQNEQTSPRIGFIGAGRMATALASGLLKSGFTTADNLMASDLYASARDQFTAATSATTSDSNRQLVEFAEIVVLAVKPQQLEAVLSEISPLVTANHLIISIAAGVTISTISSQLNQTPRVIRVMPNTPCLVGAGASAFALGTSATTDDATLVENLLTTVGLTFQVAENLLDAVTGLSGSGPAYAFQMIEALSDGGVRMGLPRDISTKLAAQTLLGAAKMVLETGEHPGALKDAVTSPGGTTIAGIHMLEEGGLRSSLIKAVTAATQRSKELQSE